MEKMKLAIVDDRKETRNVVVDVIANALDNLEMTGKWSVLGVPPLSTLKEYPEWIIRENVGILIVDERLGEVPNASGKIADYKGSDLVALLRTQYKEMPIYGVTAYHADDSLQEHFSLFDDVVERSDFAAKTVQYIGRFLRTYQNFFEENEKELTELSKISKKIAIGTASKSEKNRAEAIQRNLEIPVSTISIANRKEWLDDYEKILNIFTETQNKANKILDKNKTKIKDKKK